MKVINERKVAGNIENDLLSTLIDALDLSGSKASEKFVEEGCKTTYFEGHETSSITLKWALLPLALNPEWQARVHAEITAICKQHIPKANALRQMKLLTMVIQEMMRLYSILPVMLRETLQEDIKFGDIWFLGGVELMIPVAALHHDPDIWGPDAGEFNQERFANGASKACKFPISLHAIWFRSSNVLGRFSFTLSPNYRHSVVYGIVSEPE